VKNEPGPFFLRRCEFSREQRGREAKDNHHFCGRPRVHSFVACRLYGHDLRWLQTERAIQEEEMALSENEVAIECREGYSRHWTTTTSTTTTTKRGSMGTRPFGSINS